MPAMVNVHVHIGYEGYTSWGGANHTAANVHDHLLREAFYGVAATTTVGSSPTAPVLAFQRDQRDGEQRQTEQPGPESPPGRGRGCDPAAGPGWRAPPALAALRFAAGCPRWRTPRGRRRKLVAALLGHASPCFPRDALRLGAREAVSYTHLTLPTNREV